jgi:hypothetical protein
MAMTTAARTMTPSRRRTIRILPPLGRCRGV